MKGVTMTKTREFVMALCLMCCFFASAGLAAGQTASSSGIAHVIDLAGNADSDLDRLRYLQQIQEIDGLDPVFSQNLDSLVAFVDLWVNPDFEIRPDPSNRERAAENGYLCYFMWYGGYENRHIYSKIDEKSPLYLIARLYLAREKLWACYQSGNIWGYADRREPVLKFARDTFTMYARRFPENRIVRMHLGEYIPWPSYPVVGDAPEWAVLQREGLEKLADIISWWIDYRMLPNGEFGGGWGDDCEMWRWWAPVLLGFDDHGISAAQETFSRALLSQPHHTKGYTEHMSDVEHTAEDTGDTITPMMFIDPDNPEWSGRAKRILDLFGDVWGGTNQRGHFQFKSTYFNVERADDRPARACETPRHLAAMQPALLYWLRTGDPDAGKLIMSWMDNWVDATARSADGKPAGVIPGAIYWPDASFSRNGTSWWQPLNHGEPSLYRWPVSVNWVAETLLQTYWMSGNDKYLEPIRSMAKIRTQYLTAAPADPDSGTAMWAAGRYGGRIRDTIAKYHFLTGSHEFDALLTQEASPYVHFRLTGDRRPLTNSLRRNARAVAQNFAGFTQEVRYTDRVMVWPSRWLNATGIDRDMPSIDSGLLYGMATGDVGSSAYFPMNAVRWLTPPRNIAAFVTNTGEHFTAELYHFGPGERAMGAELYLLPKGRYTWRIDTPGHEGASNPFEVSGSRTSLRFVLPSRVLCVLRIEPVE